MIFFWLIQSLFLLYERLLVRRVLRLLTLISINVIKIKLDFAIEYSLINSIVQVVSIHFDFNMVISVNNFVHF